MIDMGNELKLDGVSSSHLCAFLYVSLALHWRPDSIFSGYYLHSSTFHSIVHFLMPSEGEKMSTMGWHIILVWISSFRIHQIYGNRLNYLYDKETVIIGIHTKYGLIYYGYTSRIFQDYAWLDKKKIITFECNLHMSCLPSSKFQFKD